jgi:hypothetical protein
MKGKGVYVVVVLCGLCACLLGPAVQQVFGKGAAEKPGGGAPNRSGPGRSGSGKTVYRVEARGSELVEVNVTELIRFVGDAYGLPVVLDPRIRGIKIAFAGPGTYSVKQILEFLRGRDVEIVWEKADGVTTIHAVLQRNLSRLVDGSYPYYGPDEPIPEQRMLATKAFRLRHGNGKAIYAAVRSLSCRDRNRLGHSVWVRGSNTLVITDLTPNLRFYAKVLDELDRPAPRGRLFVVMYEAPRELLDGKGLALGDPASLLARIEASGKARRLQKAVLYLSAGKGGKAASAVARPSRKGEKGPPIKTEVKVAAELVSEEGGVVAVVSMEIAEPGPDGVRKLSVEGSVPAAAGIVVLAIEGEAKAGTALVTFARLEAR